VGCCVVSRSLVYRLARWLPLGVAVRSTASILRLCRTIEVDRRVDFEARPTSAFLHGENDENGALRYLKLSCNVMM